MRATVSKAEIESAIESRLGSPVFLVREKSAPETIPTGISQIDSECGGLPRGAITEIVGPCSSGRTTVLYSLLAEATLRGEACALVDASDSFNPASAAAAGTDFQQLLWVRCAADKCSAHKNNALRVTDLLLQNGGWGVIALDLGDVDPRDARRIPLHAWHRFRLAIENKPTAFLVIGQEPYAASCSAMVLETNKIGARWNGLLFRGAAFQALRRKPVGHVTACFEAAALKGTEKKGTGNREQGTEKQLEKKGTGNREQGTEKQLA